MNEEAYLIARIQLIENEYRKVLRPLLDRLTKIRIEVLTRTMIVCPICGNKRCPHATDPALACTGSNEPDQPGSIYTTQPTETPDA